MRGRIRVKTNTLKDESNVKKITLTNVSHLQPPFSLADQHFAEDEKDKCFTDQYFAENYGETKTFRTTTQVLCKNSRVQKHLRTITQQDCSLGTVDDLVTHEHGAMLNINNFLTPEDELEYEFALLLSDVIGFIFFILL